MINRDTSKQLTYHHESSHTYILQIRFFPAVLFGGIIYFIYNFHILFYSAEYFLRGPDKTLNLNFEQIAKQKVYSIQFRISILLTQGDKKVNLFGFLFKDRKIQLLRIKLTHVQGLALYCIHV